METIQPIAPDDEVNAIDTNSQDLPDEDLDDVAGGGIVKDAYDVLQESWTDIKRGFRDAFND